MRTRNLLTLLLAALTAALFTIAGSTAFAALITYNGNAAAHRTGGPYTIGNLFEVGNDPITISHLGAQTNSLIGPDAGPFAADIDVGIWSGNGATQLAQVAVGSADILRYTYRYGEIPGGPITLSANTQYLIGAKVGTGFEYFEDGDLTPELQLIPDPFEGNGISFVASRYAGGGTLAPPLTPGSGSSGRWAAANAAFIPAFDPAPAVIAGDGFLQGNRNDYTGTVGTRFTIGNTDVVIDALGFEDPEGDDLTESHRVGLWNSTGAMLGEVTVPAGFDVTLEGGWRYVDLPQTITLLAGQTYSLGAEVFNGGDWWSCSNHLGTGGAPDFSLQPGIVDFNPTNAYLPNVFGFPTSSDTVEADYRWAPANARVVPEILPPATAVFAGDGDLNGNRNNYGGTVGTRFKIGEDDVVIDALGFEDPEGDDLTQSHRVGLWDSTGALLASVTVPAGFDVTFEGGWRYVELSENVTLIAGETYTLGAEVFDGGDFWSDALFLGDGVPDFSLQSGIVGVSSGYKNVHVGGGFALPTLDGALTPYRWAPANARVVPEPSSLLLAAIAGLALCLFPRRRS